MSIVENTLSKIKGLGRKRAGIKEKVNLSMIVNKF